MQITPVLTLRTPSVPLSSTYTKVKEETLRPFDWVDPKDSAGDAAEAGQPPRWSAVLSTFHQGAAPKGKKKRKGSGSWSSGKKKAYTAKQWARMMGWAEQVRACLPACVHASRACMRPVRACMRWSVHPQRAWFVGRPGCGNVDGISFSPHPPSFPPSFLPSFLSRTTGRRWR